MGNEGDWTPKDKNKCKIAPQPPVQTTQKSEADVELAIFLYLPVTPHVQHSYRPLRGKAASQQVNAQKLLSSKENH